LSTYQPAIDSRHEGVTTREEGVSVEMLDAAVVAVEGLSAIAMTGGIKAALT
jgi:hypothetical protein